MNEGCDHLRALGAYALGGLDVDEAAAVRRHIQECPECAAEYDSLAPLAGLLSAAGGAAAATAEPLSPAFEERLLDAFAREHHAPPRRRRRRWLPARPRPRWLAAGAAAAVAVAAAAGAVVLSGDDQSPRRYDVAFRSLGAAQGATANASLEGGDSGTTLHLWVRGLPRDEDAVYEVLCDAESWTATAGTFRTGADGRAYVILSTALRKGEYDAIRIVRRGHSADGRLIKRDILAARLS